MCWFICIESFSDERAAFTGQYMGFLNPVSDNHNHRSFLGVNRRFMSIFIEDLSC